MDTIYNEKTDTEKMKLPGLMRSVKKECSCGLSAGKWHTGMAHIFGGDPMRLDHPPVRLVLPRGRTGGMRK